MLPLSFVSGLGVVQINPIREREVGLICRLASEKRWHVWYQQRRASYFLKVAALSYSTSGAGKRNWLILIRYPVFPATVPLQLLVTVILNVTGNKSVPNYNKK
jgi:hypothetical protein